jgi:hypothetical protein
VLAKRSCLFQAGDGNTLRDRCVYKETDGARNPCMIVEYKPLTSHRSSIWGQGFCEPTAGP